MVEVKSNSRALRRHHSARVKRNRSRYEVAKGLTESSSNERLLGKVLKTPVNSQGNFFSNPRKINGKPTIQERRELQADIELELMESGLTGI